MQFLRRILTLVIFLCAEMECASQQLVTGRVVDVSGSRGLAYVNIGIRGKNLGTVSDARGSFTLTLPSGLLQDTLTCSLVGYKEVQVPVVNFMNGQIPSIAMQELVSQLSEVKVTSKRLVEKRFGTKNRNRIIHFTDGMFSKDDIVEIAQKITIHAAWSQITAVNLYISASRQDSASFRINFHQVNGGSPGKRLVEKSIIQRHAIREGWLRFDLTDHKIFLKGEFIAAIECIPEKSAIEAVLYEVKLGGSARSFYRKNSLGTWNTPPHHYCMNVTALVDETTSESTEDMETEPAFTTYSEAVKDTFSIYVRLPAGYDRKSAGTFPVLYHLDGNAYFNHIGHAVGDLSKKRKLRIEPIVVGIGYKNAYFMDSLRVRDYTYPPALPADSMPASGGADKFYQFLSRELIPEIDNRYRTDPTSRCLMGHSLGGYFALLALSESLTGEPVFNKLVAASPSVTYNSNFLTKMFSEVSHQQPSPNNLEILMTMGELELDEDTNDACEKLSQMIGKEGAVKLEYRRYKQLEHMGTAIPSFADGIQRFFGK